MSAWQGGPWASQRFAGGGTWRGGLWASQRAGGGGGGTDWSSVAIGDYVEGGYYAGIFNSYYLIVANVSADQTGYSWSVSTGNVIGSSGNADDGYSATQDMIAAGISNFPAAEQIVGYSADGFSDFYLASPDELLAIRDTLGPTLTSVADFQTGGAQAFDEDYYLTTEERLNDDTRMYVVRMSDGNKAYDTKIATYYRFRPIRRVPV